MMKARSGLKPNQFRNAAIAGLLDPDETIVRVAHISGAIYWKGIVVLILSFLLMLNPFIFNLGIFMLLVAVILLAHAYLMRYYLALVLTDKRVFIRQGILTLDTVQLRLNKIESAELEWPPIGRLLGYTVIAISGVGSRVVVVPFVADGVEFRAELNSMVVAQEDKPIHVINDTPKGATGAGAVEPASDI